MKARRGTWLSGLIVAVIGAAWMIAQVVGGLGSMATTMLPRPDSSAQSTGRGSEGEPPMSPARRLSRHPHQMPVQDMI